MILTNTKINVKNTPKMLSNEELYEQYHKLVLYIIHHWSTKPKDYMEHFDDIVSQVWCRLFSISIYGSRRLNPAYISFVIQTSITNAFNNIKKIDAIVPYGLISEEMRANGQDLEFYDESLYDKRSEQSIQEIDFLLILDQIYENILDLDEKIVIAAYLDLPVIRKCYAVKEIAKMIFKSKDETQIILDQALEKIKNHFVEVRYNRSI